MKHKRLRPCVELLEDRTTPSYGFGYALGFGTAGIEQGIGVAADSAGNASVTGSFNAPIDLDPGPGSYVLPNAGGVDGFAAQYDPLGNLRWGVHFGSPGSNNATRVAIDGAGNTFVAGTFTDSVQIGAPGATPVTLTAVGGTEGLLAKIDPAGNVRWARTLGEDGFRRLANGIALDSAGNVYATGEPQGTKHMYVAKYDGTSGATAWSRVVSGGTGINRGGYITFANGGDVAVDASGNVYVTGRFMGTIDFNPDPTQTNSLSNAGTTKKVTNVEPDAFVLKLNAAGGYAWAGGLGGRGSDISGQIAADGSGNVYVSGAFESFSGDADPGPGTLNLPPGSFLVKLDPSRNLLWGRSLVAGNFEVDAAGNIYSTWQFSGTIDADPGAGTFNLSSVGGTDLVVRKLDGAGNFVWAASMGGPGSEGPKAIALDGQGNIYTTGSFQNTADFDPGPGTYSLTSTPDVNGNPSSDVFISKLVPSGGVLAAGDPDTGTLSADWIAAVDFVLSEQAPTKRKR
jgi:hypothetical protein